MSVYHPWEVTRDSLSAENRQMYNNKLKLTAGIDPYAVSDNLLAINERMAGDRVPRYCELFAVLD